MTQQNATPFSTPTLPRVTPHQIRDELTEIVIKDLLGPASGPDEELSQHEDRVRERYLVGMLAPKSTCVGAEEIDDLGTSETDDPEVGPTDIATPPTDTFFPNSMGVSFVVDSEARAILVKTEWGRYRREKSAIQKGQDGAYANVWKRTPMVGDPVILPLQNGSFGPIQPRPDNDDYVVLQGKMRQTANGWVVSIFFINTQEELAKKKDEAWVFQPKMWVLDAANPPQAIFVQRRNWRNDLTKMDPLTRDETETLEMLYRHRLEFAVGHGVSVDVTLAERDAERASIVETTFISRSEVEQQTPPTPSRQ
jgi:hypothetical protein